MATSAPNASFAAKRATAGVDEALFCRIDQGAMATAGAAMVPSAGDTLAAQRGLRVAGRLDRARLEVGLRWTGVFVAVEWRGDGSLHLERSIQLAELPVDLRREIATFARGADHVVVERVSAVDRVTYQVIAHRRATRTELRLPASSDVSRDRSMRGG